MGAIFEAEHTGTERRVALKLLFPHIMSVASARAKFELEAKVSARVNSPFIVEVLDARAFDIDELELISLGCLLSPEAFDLAPELSYA